MALEHRTTHDYRLNETQKYLKGRLPFEKQDVGYNKFLEFCNTQELADQNKMAMVCDVKADTGLAYFLTQELKDSFVKFAG